MGKTYNLMFQNKRNPNKYIELKRYACGHYVARQFMKWVTPNGVVKNYTGARNAKKGRYFRFHKTTLLDILEDYKYQEEIKSQNA